MTLLKSSDLNSRDINIALLSLEADIKNKITNFDTSVIDRQLAEINSRIDKINASGSNNSSAEINDVRTEIENINSKLRVNSAKIESIELGVCPVGTILSGLYTTAPDGFLLCNGQEVAIADYFELYTVIGSLAECQSKNEGMFKVPDLRGRFLEGANGNLGKRIEAGLPNITGNMNNMMTDSGGSFSGAFYYNGKPRTRGWQGNDYDEIRNIGFDASRMPNSIYGKSNTVQPPALTVNYVIKH